MKSGAVGVMLLQLGTPEAPTTAALRRYLGQFLADPRVIDLPRWQWLPILHGIVLNTRPRKSAAEYAKVWTPKGSPLALIAAQQARLLERTLDSPERPIRVRVVMRYGEPSTLTVLQDFERAGIERIVAVPMYPQYAGATTGSSLEELFRVAATRQVVPSIRVVSPYFESPGYIRALAAGARRRLDGWSPDHVVLSFHGIPERYVKEGDPYAEHCFATARALCAEMGWPSGSVTTSFQSRFGREVWLRPYTDETLTRLGRDRTRRVLVLCPGFTADCLETIEEIGGRERHNFERQGGGEMRRVACLNTQDPWMSALSDLVRPLL